MHFTHTTSEFLPCRSCFIGCSWSPHVTLCTTFLPHLSNCCLHTDVQTALKWLVFHILHIFCHMQGTVFAHALFHSICSFPPFHVLGASLLCLSTLCLTISNSLASFMLCNATFCALYTSTLCVLISTLSLMACSMSSNATISLKILLIMPPSFSPPMKCSVSNLSTFFAFTFCCLCSQCSQTGKTNYFSCVIYSTAVI